MTSLSRRRVAKTLACAAGAEQAAEVVGELQSFYGEVKKFRASKR